MHEYTRYCTSPDPLDAIGGVRGVRVLLSPCVHIEFRNIKG